MKKKYKKLKKRLKKLEFAHRRLQRNYIIHMMHHPECGSLRSELELSKKELEAKLAGLRKIAADA